MSRCLAAIENKNVTVGQLRKALEGVADDTELVIFLPENCRPDKPDYMRWVKSVHFDEGSGISGPELEITAGEFFGY